MEEGGRREAVLRAYDGLRLTHPELPNQLRDFQVVFASFPMMRLCQIFEQLFPVFSTIQMIVPKVMSMWDDHDAHMLWLDRYQ